MYFIIFHNKKNLCKGRTQEKAVKKKRQKRLNTQSRMDIIQRFFTFLHEPTDSPYALFFSLWFSQNNTLFKLAVCDFSLYNVVVKAVVYLAAFTLLPFRLFYTFTFTFSFPYTQTKAYIM